MRVKEKTKNGARKDENQGNCRSLDRGHCGLPFQAVTEMHRLRSVLPSLF